MKNPNHAIVQKMIKKILRKMEPESPIVHRKVKKLPPMVIQLNHLKARTNQKKVLLRPKRMEHPTQQL